MSYKERYRMERKKDFERAEKRANRVGKILAVITIATMMIMLGAVSALDGNTTVALFVGLIATVIMVSCIILGERIAGGDFDQE